MRVTKIIAYIALIAMLGVLTFAACKPKQRIITSTTPVQDKEHNQLFLDILDSAYNFQTLSARLNMDLAIGTRALSSKASLRMIRDKALQLSIQPLFGVEMFRLHVDPDSLILLDRMDRQYVKESLASLKETYPVGFDFYSLQALFSNKIFVSGKSETEEADYRKFTYSQPSAMYQLTAKDEASGIEYSFTVNGDDRVTFSHLLLPEKKYSLQWGYTNFVMLGEKAFPHKMDISATTSNRKIAAELLFSNVVTGQPLQLSMNIPENYRRASASDILKIFSSDK